MGKFNFNDLMSDLSKGDVAKKEEKKEKIVYIDLYSLRPMTENFYDVSNLQDLISTLPLVGVLQPLLVKPNDDETGAYDIVAGERRWTATKYCVEELHKDELRKLPCIIRESNDEESDSDVMNGLALIFSNRYRAVSDYEKMIEMVKLEELINLAGEKKEVRDALQQFVGSENAKKEEQLTALTGMKHTQLCRHRKIYNNLCERLMNGYKSNAFQISVAYELAGLSKEYQEKAADKFEELGSISLPYVQMLREDEKAKKPIEGQMSFVKQPKKDVPLHDLIWSDENRNRMMLLFHDSCLAERAEIIEKIDASHDANNLGKDNILISLLPIETSTCTVRCDTSGRGRYEIIDIAKSESITFPIYYFWKTYNELFPRKEKSSQMPIPVRVEPKEEPASERKEEKTISFEKDIEQDIEQKEDFDEIEELEEINQEETSIEIDIRPLEFTKIKIGIQKFLLIKDENFQRNDVINFIEYMKDKPTGRTIKVVLDTIIREEKGLEDGYCILTFNLR